jgi:hypothetical protein
MPPPLSSMSSRTPSRIHASHCASTPSSKRFNFAQSRVRSVCENDGLPSSNLSARLTARDYSVASSLLSFASSNVSCSCFRSRLPPSSSRFTSKSRSHLQHFLTTTITSPSLDLVVSCPHFRVSRPDFALSIIFVGRPGGGVLAYLCTACCRPETAQAVTLRHPYEF